MKHEKIYNEEIKIGNFIAKKGIKTLDNKIQYYIVELSHLLDIAATKETTITYYWCDNESDSRLKCKVFWLNLQFSNMTFATCTTKKYKED